MFVPKGNKPCSRDYDKGLLEFDDVIDSRPRLFHRTPAEVTFKIFLQDDV